MSEIFCFIDNLRLVVLLLVGKGVLQGADNAFLENVVTIALLYYIYCETAAVYQVSASMMILSCYKININCNQPFSLCHLWSLVHLTAHPHHREQLQQIL